MIPLYLLKKHHVSKIYFIFIIIISYACCNKNIIHSGDDDYIIINDILNNRNVKKLKELDLFFEKSNNNIITIFEELGFYESQNNKIKIDSIKSELIFNAKDYDSIIEKVFNKKESKNFISQKITTKWNKKYIEDKKINITKKLINYISISSPIYSNERNIALVQVETPTLSSIYIYVKNNSTWNLHKLIATRFKHPKVQMFIKS
ncbi:hypothetical protein [Flavobacterium sp. HNIBRBA15423]|uniref:hypothetical protein n=1 Tax=Flavobacterium sp. HNIBRBA15423 TaxID=3458683 RepID=UPI004043E2E2